MTAWSSSRWKPRRRPRAASCCRTPPSRSRSAAGCVAVGPGKLRDSGERIALAVAKGDEVIYGRYAGNDVEVSGKEFKILRESDILAKVVK